MRILIKGGVWKNTEDEILKAAVMKYGKNQWARVASLLNRKSAKQCKARWYEWLDPSIKKTEWTREEEEKLLHLAKLMPNQWRTIAPIVGRTAGQCMEHYERLLDQAQAEAGETAELAPDDPRRLRPGEIDPTPETKPARPDPIDMDDDEKEMLSEARARLANTKGKKAKRKARERMLEESKRLSMLQKRRELKAAGIDSHLTMRGKRKYMDYANEIPYQKVPPSGFYDITEENDEGRKYRLDAKTYGQELQKLEGNKAKYEEEQAKKKDTKRMKDLFKNNAPDAILKMSQEGDASSLRRRLPLELPEPQVTSDELEEINKLSSTSSAALMGPPGVRATQALLGDYSEVLRANRGAGGSQGGSLRTPQQDDVIMQEAKNLRVLREMTPLAGPQELPELYEGTGFDGITPRRHSMATPNVLAAAIPGTPSSSFSSVMNTPQRSVAGGSSVVGDGRLSKSSSTNSLYLRDQFGLNNAGSDDNASEAGFSVSDVSTVFSRTDRKRSKLEQQLLLSQLQSLPEPEYSYEVAIPEMPNVEDVDDGKEDGYYGPEDAVDVQERQRKKQAELRKAELERRTQTLKQGLPRPLTVSDAAFTLLPSEMKIAKPGVVAKGKEGEETSVENDETLILAKSLIAEEMHKMILYEELKYPNDQYPSMTKKLKVSSSVANGDFNDIGYEIMFRKDIKVAETLIEEELDAMKVSASGIDYEKFNEAWEKHHKDLMFIPNDEGSGNTGGGIWKKPQNEEEKKASLLMNYYTLQGRVDKNAKKINKLQNKMSVLTEGYKTKLSSHQKGLTKVMEEYNSLYNNYEELQKIEAHEMQAAQNRYEKSRRECEEFVEFERISQQKYLDIMNYAKSCGVVLT
jgi:pre-mRNA-splicing factor CDC5/CEF1